MAESEKLEVSLKKPMGLVLEENVGGFGGLRVKEVADGGSAQVRRGCCGDAGGMHACLAAVAVGRLCGLFVCDFVISFRANRLTNEKVVSQCG